MAKEGFVVDLFFGEYFGGLVKYEDSDNYPGRKKPVIKELNTHPSQLLSRSEKKEFPYALDPEKNIKRIDEQGDFPIILLVPTGDVPELTEQQLKNTIGYREQADEKEEAEYWKDEYRDKKKELESKKKELRELRSEREEEKEREKASKKSTSDSVKCPKCDSSNPQSNWEDNNGYCPSCGDKTLDEVKG